MSTEQKSDTASRESRRSGPLVAITRWLENLGETAFAYLLLVPVFIILGSIALYPLLRTFELSMYVNVLGTGDPEFVGFQNYIDMFTGERDPDFPGSTTFLPEVTTSSSFPFVHVEGWFRSALIVTLLFTVVSVFFETVIGFGQALILDREFRGRRLVRVVIIIPWAIPLVIQGMIFYLMFHPSTGFLTEYLANAGILAPTNTLNDPLSALIIVTIADIWKTTAFMALLILAGLQSVDRSLYDVAKVAGASRWQQFRLITLPLVLPAVGVAVLFRTIDAMRIYGLVDITSSCTVVPSLSCMVVETFNTNRGLASAIAFVTAGIIGALAMIVIYRQFKEGF
ncbi:sugar ABC transporter permease [Natronococcus sp. JC468]|uniref:carbohydrate ABC transporter permease n=1 Tax=Natronococcus sp. JC468 TaxID=1961921 RepID=UPI00143B524B|nr:sugar ABC transporter permease [Natronococcus sp. JC468]NKE34835.1 sugar ABC transporter permease [Natronococcus sp. JC468]